MKIIIKISFLLLFITLITSCESHAGDDNHKHQNSKMTAEPEQEEHEHTAVSEVHLTQTAFINLDIRSGKIQQRDMGEYIDVNGYLTLPPQAEANVTSMLGANVYSIKVIQGDKVKKGQVLGYLTHPDFIIMQSEYMEASGDYEFLEEEYNRQKNLFDKQVIAERDLQKTRSDYLRIKSRLAGLHSQLLLLGLNPDKIKQGKLYKYIPVVSPVKGYVQKVYIKTGQYVEPQTLMFRVINTDEIHADFMVFEKDVIKVKTGQTVLFEPVSMEGEVIRGKVFAVGKEFEKDPKALHIHARFDRNGNNLIPGMYVRGKLLIHTRKVNTLPEEAIVKENDNYYIFGVEKVNEQGTEEWHFTPVEVAPGIQDDGYVEILSPDSKELPENIALNKAYYLLSEMKKEEAGHQH